MYTKIFHKSVGAYFLLVGFLFTILLPAVFTFAPPAYAVIPNPGPGGNNCPGTNPINGILGACDGAWADGSTIAISDTIKRDVDRVARTGNTVTHVDITPAVFRETSTSGTNGANMILNSPMPSSTEDGTTISGCSPIVLEVDNYQAAANGGIQTAQLKIPKLPTTVSVGGDIKCPGGYESNIPLVLGNTWNSVTNNGTGNLGSGAPSSGPSTNGGPTCAIPSSSTKLYWILCPIMLLAQGAISILSGALSNLLFTPTDQIFTPGFQGAFNNFRDIGVALLVIAGLVMVVSQAAGLEIFAAYTVRKALPRIVIAAIGMALAWDLLKLIIIFFNDLGVWSSGLVIRAAQVPYQGTPDNAVTNAIAGIGAGTVIVGGLLASAGIVFSYLVMILLGLFIGFIVLAVRQLVILICILIAPLAIAASVLPGTQKLWVFWRDTLLAALVMFPIIMSFMGAGTAMSYIAGAAADAANKACNNSGSTLRLNHPKDANIAKVPDTTLTNAAGKSQGITLTAALVPNQQLQPANGGPALDIKTTAAVCTQQGLTWSLLSAATFIAPLFMLPFAFRLAGGLMATIFSLAQDRHKGAFNRLRDYRANKFGQRVHAAKSGKFWRGNNGLARLGSRAIAGAAAIAEEPLSPSRARALYASRLHDNAMEALEKNSDMRAIKDNDTLLAAALSGNGTAQDAKQYLEAQRAAGKYNGTDADINRDVGSIMRARRSMGDRTFMAAAAVAQAGTGTGYKDAGDMLETIARASGGNRALAGRMLAAARPLANQSGRQDLAGMGFGDQANELSKAMNGQKVDTDFLHRKAFESTDAVSLGRGRTSSIQNITGSVTKRIDHLSSRSGENRNRIAALKNTQSLLRPLTNDEIGEMNARQSELDELGRLSASLANFKDSSMMYAAPEKVQAAAGAIRQAGPDIRGASQETTYSEHRQTRGPDDNANNPNRQQP